MNMTVVGVSTELGRVMEQLILREEPNTASDADTITPGLGTEGEMYVSYSTEGAPMGSHLL